MVSFFYGDSPRIESFHEKKELIRKTQSTQNRIRWNSTGNNPSRQVRALELTLRSPQSIMLAIKAPK